MSSMSTHFIISFCQKQREAERPLYHHTYKDFERFVLFTSGKDLDNDKYWADSSSIKNEKEKGEN